MSGERIDIRATPIEGLMVLERRPIHDQRGFLERLFCEDELRPFIGEARIHAINRTVTLRTGTVRGLHYQVAPAAEMKVVTCLRGAAFDVAVDLRRGSPTFLRWHAERLTEDNRVSILVPRGVAHGLQSLSDGVEMLYLHTAPHRPECERGIDALDPTIGIDWPLAVQDRSERDRSHYALGRDFHGLDT